MSPTTTLIPIPPSGVPLFNVDTGQVDILWQNYFQALQDFGGVVPPIDARYWLGTADTALTNEQNIGLLATGYLKVTTAIGTATPSTTAKIPAVDIAAGTAAINISGNAATATTAATASAVAGANVTGDGTYTPALTSVANVTASTPYVCQYYRVGNQVTVSGKVDIDPTAGATLTQLGISLPIASNFGAAENCGGTAVAAVPSYAASIAADLTNDRAQLDYTTVFDVANRSFFFSFTYRVI